MEQSDTSQGTVGAIRTRPDIPWCKNDITSSTPRSGSPAQRVDMPRAAHDATVAPEHLLSLARDDARPAAFSIARQKEMRNAADLGLARDPRNTLSAQDAVGEGQGERDSPSKRAP